MSAKLPAASPHGRRRSCPCTRSVLLVGLLCACALASSCTKRSPTTPTDPAAQVVPTEGTGPVRISFVTANVAPGSTITGCGPLIDGCRGRLRFTLRLTPSQDGPVLYARVYLHSMRNLVACLSGQTGPFTVTANRATDIEVTLDEADRCGVPDTMATMDAILEGPAPTASRQAWTIRYQFER